MKRSTQIGLAAVGVILAAAMWSTAEEESQESLVYDSLAECQAGGQITAQQCEAALNQAAATRLSDAPKFNDRNACESQYGAAGCAQATIGGASYFIPALAGFMLARGLAANQAQPLLPPTTAACPPGSPQPECQQARGSSSSGGGGGGGGGGSRSRAYSSTSGRGITVAPTGMRGISTATSVASRGGFGSTARSFSAHSSS